MMYLTADPHLGHKGVLKHDNRPFEDIDQHDRYILDRYHGLPRGSELWVLGDVAWTKETLEEFFRVTSHLMVHLVRGNHDDKLAWKARSRFASAHEAVYLKRQIGSETVKLYLSHYAHRTWRNSCHGAYHFHGHSHGALPRLGRSMDVGVNVHQYRPISLIDAVTGLSGSPLTPHH